MKANKTGFNIASDGGVVLEPKRESPNRLKPNPAKRSNAPCNECLRRRKRK